MSCDTEPGLHIILLACDGVSLLNVNVYACNLAVVGEPFGIYRIYATERHSLTPGHDIVTGVSDCVFNAPVEPVAADFACLQLVPYVCNRPVVAQLETGCQALANGVNLKVDDVIYACCFNILVQVGVVLVVELVRCHMRQLRYFCTDVPIFILVISDNAPRCKPDVYAVAIDMVIAIYAAQRIGIDAATGKGDKEAWLLEYIKGLCLELRYSQ